MELLYADFIYEDIQYQNEFCYFVFNYLIGEKVQIHSNVGFFMYVLKNINNLNDDEVINYFEDYLKQSDIEGDEELTQIYLDVDNIKKKCKIYKSLKNAKRLSKEGLAFVQTHKNVINSSREGLYQACVEILNLCNMKTFIELLDQEKIVVSYSSFNRDRVLNDKEVCEQIFNVLLNKDKMLVIGSLLSEYTSLKLPDNIYELPSDDIDEIEILIIDLITMPCSIDLSNDNLIVLRKQFQLKFNFLFDKVQEFRKIISKFNFDIDIKEKTIAFRDSIKYDLQSLQNDIDKHIYFQKIINTDTEYINITLKLGIVSNETIGLVYTSTNVISIETVIDLKEKIDRELGEEMCEVIIYYEIENIIIG